MLDYQDYTTEVDHYQSNGNGYHGNGYDKLDGDWLTYYRVAKGFTHRVKPEDREDFLHDLILVMAKVKAKYEVIGKPLSEAGLISTQTKQPDLCLEKAHSEHLDEIRALVQKWRANFNVKNRPGDMYIFPPRYGVEQDKLFPYVLDHCPSIKAKYKTLVDKKTEYQVQPSELKKNQSDQ